MCCQARPCCIRLVILAGLAMEICFARSACLPSPPKLPTMPAARRSRVFLSGKTPSSPFQSIPVCRRGTFHSLAPLTGVDIEPLPSLESSHHRDQFCLCLSQAKLSQFPVGTRVVPRRNFVNYYYSPHPPRRSGNSKQCARNLFRTSTSPVCSVTITSFTKGHRSPKPR
jgi:hypothetical protein